MMPAAKKNKATPFEKVSIPSTPQAVRKTAYQQMFSENSHFNNDLCTKSKSYPFFLWTNGYKGIYSHVDNFFYRFLSTALKLLFLIRPRCFRTHFPVFSPGRRGLEKQFFAFRFRNDRRYRCRFSIVAHRNHRQK